MTEFDYIIVGAGTAGCVLAARLTQDPGTRVLLLEAGGAERTRAMTVPDAWPDLLGTAADWADVTSAQADAGPVPYPRGRTLGALTLIAAESSRRTGRTLNRRTPVTPSSCRSMSCTLRRRVEPWATSRIESSTLWTWRNLLTSPPNSSSRLCRPRSVRS